MTAPPDDGPSTTRLGALWQFARDFGALIGTVSALAGFIGLFWADIPVFWKEAPIEVSVSAFVIIGLLSLFAVYAQVIDPLLGRLRRNRMIELTPESRPKRESKPEEALSFRLRPYEGADRDDYARPDGAHERALRWLRDAKQTFLYLTGSSGTGKSSLLQAWLIPELEGPESSVRALIVRSYADPIGQLIAGLRAEDDLLADLPDEETDPRALLERAALSTQSQRKRLLIAIDQFEECLILQDDEAKSHLAGLFLSLQKTPIEGLQFLLVLREDYLDDELTAFHLPAPWRGENWFKLGPLSHANARKLLRRALPSMSQSLEDKVVKEASEVDDLPGRILPITLNMMGMILKDFAGATLTRATPGRLIQDFLRQAMAKSGIDQIAPRLLAEMITDNGTKKPMNEAALVDVTGIEPMLVHGTLSDLYEEGVVRELDRGRRLWEISHDFVARQLGQIIPRLKPSLWQRTRRQATAIALTSWLVVLVGGLTTYQIWHDAVITNKLRAAGVIVAGEQGAYRVELDKAVMQSDTLEDVFPNIEELQPIALIIRGANTLPDDPSFERVSVNGRAIDGPSFAGIPDLAGLDSLKVLEVWHSDRVTTLSGLQRLNRLERLVIEGNDGLITVDGLDGLSALRMLSIRGNDFIAELNGVEGMESLETFILEGTEVATLDGLQHLTRLQKIDLSDNHRLTILPDLDQLEALTELTIFKNDRLRALTGLDGLGSLEKLHIFKNGSLTAAEGLNNLEKLRSVVIRFNDELAMRNGFAGLSALEELHIEDNRGPFSLASLTDSKKLVHVLIWGNRLENVPGFESFEALDWVAVDGGDLAASIDALKRVSPTVQIRASHRYINTGYAEKLNEARFELGLGRLRVVPHEQL